MIPRQQRKISFYDEYTQALKRIPMRIIPLMLIINNIFVTIIFITFAIYDSQANDILLKQNINNTDLYAKYGYNSGQSSFGSVAFLVCIYICVAIYLIAFVRMAFEDWEWFSLIKIGFIGFIFNLFGALFSVSLTYPYIQDQIIGPGYQIIQCDYIDSLGSWQDQWCTFHKHRIILSWLLIFVWLTIYPIYFSIAPSIAIVVLCKRGYRISKLWVVYQYQYRKGLFLTWLKNIKSDKVDNETNTVEIVTIKIIHQ